MKQKVMIVFLMLCATQVSIASVYKWTDPQGNVHYSNTPGNPNAEKMVLEPAPPKNPVLDKRRETYKKNQAVKTAEQDKPAAKANQNIQQQIEIACMRYRENLALLQSNGQRLYTVRPDGEYHYLSDEERERQIKSTQKLIAENCGTTKK